jgi:MtN3 and saliva related transmembrane protein
MPLHDIIGFVAGFGTTFAAMPDLIAMLKRRSCEGMNPTMAAIMGTFQILWVYYGILVDSRPVIVWNVIAVAINFLVVGAYFYFASSGTRQAPMIDTSGRGSKGPLGH